MAQYLNIIRYAAQSEDKTEALLHAEQLPEPALAQKPNSHSVQFKDVSFSYDGISCLENVEFTAYPGEITAIVGPSGSGKTTLMNLICRFSDPDSGVVSIGGYDIKKIGTEEVYKSVSMVFQNVQLFSSTIMDNIRIGRPDATDEEVYEACNNAYCLDFINTLPLGFDTQIGERGSRLSGGEKQRISIARAFLKDAPILLLDEIAASVDSIAQYEIQQALKTLIAGKTLSSSLIASVPYKAQTKFSSWIKGQLYNEESTENWLKNWVYTRICGEHNIPAWKQHDRESYTFRI